MPEEVQDEVVDPVVSEEAGPFKKTADGWEVVIDIGGGAGVQRYIGKTKDEVSMKLIEAQQNASRKIRQQERALHLGEGPEEFVPESLGSIRTFEPEEANEAEVNQLYEDLRNEDRSKAARAHARLTEIQFGAPMQDVRSTLRRTSEIDHVLKCRAAGERFRATHPELKNTLDNAQAIANYCEKKGWDPTFKNLEEAFTRLKRSTNILEFEDDVELAPPAPSIPAPVPISVRSREGSTGLRPSQSTATRNAPTSTAQAQSDAEFRLMVDRMSTDDYLRKLRTDPKFKERADKLL